MKELKVYIYPIIFVCIWGLTFVWTESILKVYSPLNMLFIRLVFASFFLFFMFRKKLQKIEKSDYKILFLAGLCQPFLYFIGETFGIKYSDASFASIMIALIPLFTPIASLIFLKTKFNWMIFLGLIVAFFGVLLMSLSENMEFVVDYRGVLFLSLAVLSAVLYAICIMKISHKYNNFTIVYTQTLVGTVLFAPLFFIFGFKEFLSIPFQMDIYIKIICLAVLGSGVAFLCFVQSVKEIGAVRTHMFSNFIPIATAIGSYFILDELVTRNQIIGICIVIFGLFVSQIKAKKKIL